MLNNVTGEKKEGGGVFWNRGKVLNVVRINEVILGPHNLPKILCVFS